MASGGGAVGKPSGGKSGGKEPGDLAALGVAATDGGVASIASARVSARAPSAPARHTPHAAAMTPMCHIRTEPGMRTKSSKAHAARGCASAGFSGDGAGRL
jgi:hypothetical protein